ncbi:hypothetical protein [Alienimonas californiensis]|uniref:Uncharacterized protein n=1 Tax=Alienimonas californiensis TaxID=2527989 RepID=A0A517P778_9PLAN|nr:hypothetical protein [Alienimonas californiensis]QDT15213.1 hypothetical protein CA12_12950 [Alienimonas californiensis]
MVARSARLSAVRSSAAGLSAPRAIRRPAPPRTATEADLDSFDAFAGAARILVGPPRAEPTPVEPPFRGLSGANWLSGPMRAAARARRDARRAAAARAGEAGAARRAA